MPELDVLVLAYRQDREELSAAWDQWKRESIAAIEEAGGAVTSSADKDGFCRDYRIIVDVMGEKSFGGGVSREGDALTMSNGPGRWKPSEFKAPHRPDVGDKIDNEARALREIAGKPQKSKEAIELYFFGRHGIKIKVEE